MSWYIENLLRNSIVIRDGIMKSKNDTTVLNTNSDMYMDLLSVEKTVKKLSESGLINPFDIKIVNLLESGLSIEEVADKLKVARPTITKKFSAVCNRIAFILGDNFSDSGYLNYLADKYNLTEEQIHRAFEYMKNSSKRIITKQE